MAPADDLTHIGQRLSCLQLCALYRRTITATCPACGDVRRLDAVALWWLFERRGWDDRLPGAFRRLTCQPCRDNGRKVHRRAEITRDVPDLDQPPYPDQRTWRRIVSRYRS